MRLLWEVAEGRHPTADSLGELSGIALDRAGNVYVADLSNAKIWVFDRLGRSQPAIGRKGQGPGEFEAPTGLAIGPDGALYVRDVARVTRFGGDSTTGRLARYLSRVQPGFYLRYSRAGVLLDSVEVPAFPNAPKSTAYVRLSANGGRMLQGLNFVPFAPLPTWDITPRGTSASPERTSFDVFEPDGRLRTVVLLPGAIALEPTPVLSLEEIVAIRVDPETGANTIQRFSQGPP